LSLISSLIEYLRYKNHFYDCGYFYSILKYDNPTVHPSQSTLLSNHDSLKELWVGVSFDQLVIDIILDVLAMDSTGMRMNTSGISVPEDIKSRYAKGHMAGKEVNLEFIPEAIQSAGAMYSTTNDLLMYLSANMGLIQTKIQDAMHETHLIRHSFGESSSDKSLKDYIGLGWTVTMLLHK
jgi:hypothetical protein